MSERPRFAFSFAATDGAITPESFAEPPTVPYVATIWTSPVSRTVTRPSMSTLALMGFRVAQRT